MRQADNETMTAASRSVSFINSVSLEELLIDIILGGMWMNLL